MIGKASGAPHAVAIGLCQMQILCDHLGKGYNAFLTHCNVQEHFNETIVVVFLGAAIS
jgi:hypothetical protein